MENKNKIVAFNIASTVILQGLAFFSGPIFSGLLGPNNYGIASVYLTWVQLASTIFTLQAGGTLAIARNNFPLEDQLKYQSSVLSLAAICYVSFSFLTIAIVLMASKLVNISIPMLITGLIHGWGLYCVLFMNSKFTYEFEAGKNFVLSVIVSILTIVLSIFLIKQYSINDNYWGRILGQAIIYGIIGSICYLYVLLKGRVFFDRQYWSFTLPIAIPTIFHLLASIVLNQSDRVMLQKMVNSSAAGIYALACTFGAVLSTIYNALNNSWVPYYFEFSRQEQIKELRKHAKNYIELFTIITIGFILLCKEVFQIYAKEAFWTGTDLIPLFSIGYYFVFLYSFPVNYEFYNKKTKMIAVGTSFAAICNIILNIIGIKLWGILGAVTATAISHALQFGFHFFSANRIKPGEFPFKLKDLLPGFCAVLVACCLYWVTRDLWVIRWLTGAGLGIYLLIKIIRRKEIF